MANDHINPASDTEALAHSIFDAVSEAMTVLERWNLEDQPGAENALPSIAAHARELSKGLNELCHD